MIAKSQSEAVLKHLKNHKNGITPMTAFARYGITRLSAIIFNLRKTYTIATIEEEDVNRYGHRTRYARYVLEEK